MYRAYTDVSEQKTKDSSNSSKDNGSSACCLGARVVLKCIARGFKSFC